MDTREAVNKAIDRMLNSRNERIAQLEDFLHELLSPERFGYAVTAEVRDRARVLLGMESVETGRRLRADLDRHSGK